VIAVARMTVCVGEDAPLRGHRFVSAAGEPVAWLNVGEAGELCVYGSPEVMRRLGEAVLAAADEAEELAPGCGRLRVVVGSDGD
jgi:hypothetical protein